MEFPINSKGNPLRTIRDRRTDPPDQTDGPKNFEKHDFHRNHHQENGRLRLFMKGNVKKKKSPVKDTSLK